MAFPKRRNLQEIQRKQLVIVGSRNPVKISCTEEAFHLTFSDQILVQALDVDSGVSTQPFGDQETYLGAYNRAANCRSSFPEADFWVGIEGGVEEMGEDLTAFAWIVVLDKAGGVGRSKTASFFLPPAVAQLVNQGIELGVANDQVFQEENSKQQGGAVGSLTRGAVGRKELYKQAVVLALIPFSRPELYGHSNES
ncbi:MAG TPA: inosine/xanthosine triphosphatase [Cyclobacteriaceae bacterium]|nr:inosine/xanthosine triphosphatase [Cyclobacteriaceae bacterium]